VGDIVRETAMTLVAKTSAGHRLTDGMILPELEGGNSLVMEYTRPARAISMTVMGNWPRKVTRWRSWCPIKSAMRRCYGAGQFAGSSAGNHSAQIHWRARRLTIHIGVASAADVRANSIRSPDWWHSLKVATPVSINWAGSRRMVGYMTPSARKR
jgi:hypothetical protein